MLDVGDGKQFAVGRTVVSEGGAVHVGDSVGHGPRNSRRDGLTLDSVQFFDEAVDAEVDGVVAPQDARQIVVYQGAGGRTGCEHVGNLRRVEPASSREPERLAERDSLRQPNLIDEQLGQIAGPVAAHAVDAGRLGKAFEQWHSTGDVLGFATDEEGQLAVRGGFRSAADRRIHVTHPGGFGSNDEVARDVGSGTRHIDPQRVRRQRTQHPSDTDVRTTLHELVQFGAAGQDGEQHLACLERLIPLRPVGDPPSAGRLHISAQARLEVDDVHCVTGVHKPGNNGHSDATGTEDENACHGLSVQTSGSTRPGGPTTGRAEIRGGAPAGPHRIAPTTTRLSSPHGGYAVFVAVTELIVVRHGESVGNVAADRADAEQAETVAVDERDADVPLTRRGEAQAAALGDWLSGIETARHPAAVLCSPYMRARQTAGIALQTAGQAPPIRLDERLRDRELGILDRLTARGIRSRFPDEAHRRAHLGKFYYRPPGGESWADVCLRLRPVIVELDRNANDIHGTMLIVCHDAVIFLLRYLLEELTEREVLDIASARSLGNGAVTTFARRAAGAPWHLEVFDVREHLVAGGVEATTHSGARDDAHPG